jgi:hypothetical protein
LPREAKATNKPMAMLDVIVGRLATRPLDQGEATWLLSGAFWDLLGSREVLALV